MTTIDKNNWCIRITPENRIKVTSYLNSTFNTIWSGDIDTYYGVRNGVHTTKEAVCPAPFCKAITYSEFKQYILNEVPEASNESEAPNKWYIKPIEKQFEVVRNWAKQKNPDTVYETYQWHSKVGFDSNGKYREHEDNDQYPLITFEQFMEYINTEKFILPSKWAVKITPDNADIIDAHRKTLSDYDSGLSAKKYPNRGYWYLSDNAYSGRMSWCETLNKNYKEITNEQFLKYIINQPKMEKQIIGYRLKKECEQFREAAQLLSKFDLSLTESYIQPPFSPNNTGANGTKMYNNLKEAKVLDLWFEPVFFKEDTKEYTLESGYIVTIHKNGAITSKNANFTIQELKKTFPISTGQKFEPQPFAGYKIEIVYSSFIFKIGCQKVTSTDMLNICKIHEKLNS